MNATSRFAQQFGRESNQHQHQARRSPQAMQQAMPQSIQPQSPAATPAIPPQQPAATGNPFHTSLISAATAADMSSQTLQPRQQDLRHHPGPTGMVEYQQQPATPVRDEYIPTHRGQSVHMRQASHTHTQTMEAIQPMEPVNIQPSQPVDEEGSWFDALTNWVMDVFFETVELDRPIGMAQLSRVTFNTPYHDSFYRSVHMPEQHYGYRS